jgi:hypothetical protein
MNIDAKSSIKYLQTELNNAIKRSYTMIKSVLFQGCKDGPIYTNQ